MAIHILYFVLILQEPAVMPHQTSDEPQRGVWVESRWPTTLLGDEQLRLGNLDRAEMHYVETLIELEMLSHEAPNLDWQREFSIALERLGDVYQRRGALDEAISYYRKSLEGRLEIVRLETVDPAQQRELWIAHYRVAETERLLLNYDTAISHFADAIDIAQRMAVDSPDNTALAEDLEFLETRLRFTQDARQLIELEQRGISLPSIS